MACGIRGSIKSCDFIKEANKGSTPLYERYGYLISTNQALNEEHPIGDDDTWQG